MRIEVTMRRNKQDFYPLCSAICALQQRVLPEASAPYAGVVRPGISLVL
jgi:hypothetical protein